MNMRSASLGFSEKVIFSLRSLYEKYGYSQYKMSKFEEYDLYARNKDFLISDSVITFTDTNGKLMALKPDVTLSIVKNSKDAPDFVQKLYYNENVYRVSKGSHAFQEIMQVGLECLGMVDNYCICEVLMLAAQSLRCISENALLDISHLGLISDLLDQVGIPGYQKAEALKFIGEKNIHELMALCRNSGVTEENAAVLRQLVAVSGDPETVLPQIKTLLSGIVNTSSLEQLERIACALKGSEIYSMVRIDFSVVDDFHYYNGIVFKGFVYGLPESVLSGGQYDKLMQKMKRRSGAIGFAVYMDMLERLEDAPTEYDVDTLLLYDENSDLSAIQSHMKALTENGCSVMVQRQIPENIKYRCLLKLQNGEVETLEGTS